MGVGGGAASLPAAAVTSLPATAAGTAKHTITVDDVEVTLHVNIDAGQVRQLLNMGGIEKMQRGDHLVITSNEGKYYVSFHRNFSGVATEKSLVMNRTFDVANKKVHNNLLFIGNDAGVSGTEVFGHQVKTLQSLGYKSITTVAAGEKGSDFNGYYTWLRFGYEPLNNSPDLMYSQGVKIYKKNPTLYSPDGTITGLMQTAAGRELWKEYGQEFYGRFDLTKGSYSDRTFRAYYKQKTRK